MSKYSNAGTFKAFPLVTTADVAPLIDGHAFSVVVFNNSGAAINAGSVVMQEGDALANDPCAPNLATMADVSVPAQCDDPAGTAATVGGVTFSAGSPIPSKGQWHISWPCAKGFLRLKANPPAGIVVTVVVSQLRNQ